MMINEIDKHIIMEYIYNNLWVFGKAFEKHKLSKEALELLKACKYDQIMLAKDPKRKRDLIFSVSFTDEEFKDALPRIILKIVKLDKRPWFKKLFASKNFWAYIVKFDLKHEEVPNCFKRIKYNEYQKELKSGNKLTIIGGIYID